MPMAVHHCVKTDLFPPYHNVALVLAVILAELAIQTFPLACKHFSNSNLHLRTGCPRESGPNHDNSKLNGHPTLNSSSNGHLHSRDSSKVSDLSLWARE